MARYTGPKVRVSRRLSTNIFENEKGRKALDRRPFPPGAHGRTRRRNAGSEYLAQLQEKQKAKAIYGVLERQFRKTYEEALRHQGNTGLNLLIMLETRLDNIVYRLGFASSRKAARQLIGHGHVEVNGKRVDIPSFRVLPGQEIRVAPSSRELVSVHMAQEYASRGQPVSWLNIDTEKASGRLLERPTREAIPINAQEQLIVELYSK